MFRTFPDHTQESLTANKHKQNTDEL